MSGFAVGSDGVAIPWNEWINNRDADADTGFAPQIDARAWSAGAQPPQPANYHERHAWTTVVRAAGIGVGLVVALAGLLLLCGAVFGGHSEADDHTSWPSGYTNPPLPQMPAPPPETPLPWPPPPVGDASHLTRDGEYLQRLRVEGFDVVDPAQSLAFAQSSCANLARGYTVSQIVVAVYVEYPGVSTVQRIELEVRTAAAFYCPGLS
jgi:hypothetical protein